MKSSVESVLRSVASENPKSLPAGISSSNYPTPQNLGRFTFDPGQQGHSLGTYAPRMDGDEADRVLRTNVGIKNRAQADYDKTKLRRETFDYRLRNSDPYKTLSAAKLEISREMSDLSRIVASGKATPEQIKKLDELKAKYAQLDEAQDKLISEAQNSQEYKKIKEDLETFMRASFASDDPAIITAKVVAARERNDPRLIAEALDGRIKATLADAQVADKAKTASELAKLTAADLQEVLKLRPSEITGLKKDGDLIYLLEKGSGDSSSVVQARVEKLLELPKDLKNLNVKADNISFPSTSAPPGSGPHLLHELTVIRSKMKLLYAIEDRINDKFSSNPESPRLLSEIEAQLDSEKKRVYEIEERLRKLEGDRIVELINSPLNLD
ncbi:MAG: hypothetical protein ACK5W9_01760 [Bdellovibrionales bacterium]